MTHCQLKCLFTELYLLVHVEREESAVLEGE